MTQMKQKPGKLIASFLATSETWTRTLDPKPGQGPWNTWTLKNLDPEQPGPWTTWTLRNLDPEKQEKQLDVEKW